MATFYASYPPNISSGTISEYANFAAFPSAASAGNGALALALDTEFLYVSNGSAWTVIAGPGAATLTPGTISTSTTGVTVGSGASSTVGPNVTVNVQTASGSQPGLLSAADWTTFNNKGSGTVTSVALSVPAFLSVAGSPVTTSGTLAVSLSGTALPVANGGTGVTSLGNLTDVGTDGIVVTGGTGSLITSASIAQHVADSTHNGYLSSTDWTTFNNKGSGSVTSVAMSVPSFLSVAGSPVTTSGTLAVSLSGTALPVANGGTGLTSGTSGGILGYTASGTLASSGALTVSQLIIGGGAGATPSTLSAGSTGNVLTIAGGIPTWAAPATSGTVTSVALSMPAIFSVAGSPITSSGTLAVTLATETANTVWAGPTTGSAATPTFRALVGADIPGFTITNNGTTGTINDLAWTTNTIRFNGASAVVLNGVAAQAEGTVLTIFNDTGAALTIANAAAGSSAVNRFSIRNASGSPFLNIILQTSSSMGFMYQQAVWRPIAPTGAVGDVILNSEQDVTITATATIQNIDSITLPPGTWHVQAGGNVASGVTTVFTDEYDLMLSIVSNASAGTQSGYDYARVEPLSTASTFTASVRVDKFVQSDGTQVVWLNHRANYTGNNPTTRASMWAVKIR